MSVEPPKVISMVSSMMVYSNQHAVHQLVLSNVDTHLGTLGSGSAWP